MDNNSSGNQSTRGFERAYGGQQTERGKDLSTYAKHYFAKIAEDIGAPGSRAEKPLRDRPRAPAGALGRLSGSGVSHESETVVSDYQLCFQNSTQTVY